MRALLSLRKAFHFSSLILIFLLAITCTLMAQDPATVAVNFLFSRLDVSAPPSVSITGGATGDFNGDGIVDTAVYDFTSGKVFVVFGTPDGSFQPFSSAIGTSVPGPLAAMFPGRYTGSKNVGLLGMHQGSATSEVLFLPGLGNGGFGTASTALTGNFFTAMAVGDLNKDGHSDFAVSDQITKTVTVMLGDGKGGFKTSQTLSSPAGVNALAIGDLNGDGIPDLAIGANGVMATCPGKGDGTFGACVLFTVPGQVNSLALGDFNKDGKLDYVAGIASNVYVGLGNGDGTFGTPVANTISGNAGFGIQISDFNGSGKQGVAVTIPSTNQIAWLGGTGSATLGRPIYYQAGRIPNSLTILDANGDGRPDLFTSGNSPSGYSVLVNTGVHLNPFSPRMDNTIGSGPVGVAIASLRNNGNNDAVTANSGAGTISVRFGDGSGNLGVETDYGSCPMATSVVLQDVNSDGFPDAIVGRGDSTGGFCQFLNKGDGTFLSPTFVSASGATHAIVLAKFDGNSTMYVAGIVPAANEVQVWKDDGTGNWTPVNTVTVTAPTAIVSGDFNGDGKADVAVANANDTFIYLGGGSGSLTLKSTLTTGGSALATADFNGDGKADLAVGGPSATTAFLGNGDGTFASGMDTGLGAAIALAARDLNGDGKVDLVGVDNTNNVVKVAFGNGDGSFQLRLPFQVGTNPDAVAVGDLNGDGVPDLVTANNSSSDSSLSVLVDRGMPAVSPRGGQVFPITVVNTTSSPKTFTAYNSGLGGIMYDTFIATPSVFKTTSDNCSGTKQVSLAFCTVQVEYAPTATGSMSGDLEFTANGINEKEKETGTGTQIALSPPTLTFPNTPVGGTSQQTVTLTNVLSTPMTVSFGITGPNASNFLITNNGCGASVAGNTSCTEGVTFAPTATGTKRATLNIHEGDIPTTRTVPMSGDGT